MRPFDEDDLSYRVAPLTLRQRVAFSTACAERVVDFHEAFLIQEGLGPQAALRKALEATWAFAASGNPRIGDWPSSVCALEQAMPRRDQIFHSIFATAASDACEVVLAAVEQIISPSSRRAIEAALLNQGIVEMYLALVNQPLAEDLGLESAEEWSKASYAHLPLFLAELNWQETNLAMLAAEVELSIETVALLRDRASRGVAPTRRFHLLRSGAPHDS
jgi:uncharacterized protein YjaG (DUF416 family)